MTDEPKRCATCDSGEHLQDSHGAGGLNDVCKPCFYIWLDADVGCKREECRDRKLHIHGEDIGAYCLKARSAGTWPFNSAEFRVAA